MNSLKLKFLLLLFLQLSIYLCLQEWLVELFNQVSFQECKKRLGLAWTKLLSILSAVRVDESLLNLRLKSGETLLQRGHLTLRFELLLLLS